MATVVLGARPPELEQWLARRRALGQDRADEVWEGDYHVVPGPSGAHALVDNRLARLIGPLAERRGLTGTTAFNLGHEDDYRVPDGGLHRSSALGVYIPSAALVAEVLSPGDETFAKFPFYARCGVEEVLVADPATRTVRLWQLRAAGAGEEPSYAETGRSDLLGVTGADLASQLPWP